MQAQQDIKYFRKKILDWFGANQRDFPWRREGASNYEILISEILLQRTKAETVAKYYGTFFSRYPGWDSLAAASLQDLEDILKPLGLYKHRAKRLKKITEEYIQKQGNLPKNKDELQESNLSSEQLTLEKHIIYNTLINSKLVNITIFAYGF